MLTQLFLQAVRAASRPPEAQTVSAVAKAMLERTAAEGSPLGWSMRALSEDLSHHLHRQPDHRPLSPKERSQIGALLAPRAEGSQSAPAWWSKTRSRLADALQASDNLVFRRELPKLLQLGEGERVRLSAYLQAMAPADTTPMNYQRAQNWLDPQRGLAAPPPVPSDARFPDLVAPLMAQQAPAKPLGALGKAPTALGLQTLSLGKQLAYVFGASFAEGSFARAYHGVDADGRPVVLKGIQVANLAAAPKAPGARRPPRTLNVDAVLREVAYLAIAGASTHPRQVMQAGDSLYLAMNAHVGALGVAMGSLHAAGLGADLGRHLLYDVAKSLADTHRSGLLHNDIKPANLLIDAQGNICVADYGIAGPLILPKEGELPVLFGQHGSVGYLGPEYYAGEPAPATADVFALGMVYMAALLGKSDSPLRVPKVETAMADFVAWHTQLPRDVNGALLPPNMQATEQLWDRHYAEAYKTDPQMAPYVVAHLLEPDPYKRATAQAVCAHMNVQPEIDAARLRCRAALLKYFQPTAQETETLSAARAYLGAVKDAS